MKLLIRLTIALSLSIASPVWADVIDAISDGGAGLWSDPNQWSFSPDPGPGVYPDNGADLYRVQVPTGSLSISGITPTVTTLEVDAGASVLASAQLGFSDEAGGLLQNDGLVELLTGSGNALRAFGSLTALGDGEIRLSHNSATLRVDGRFLNQNTITGRGFFTVLGSLLNGGTISADQPGLTLATNSVPFVGNDGVLEARGASARLDITTPVLHQGTNGVIRSVDDGRVRLFGTTAVSGGRIEAIGAGSDMVLSSTRVSNTTLFTDPDAVIPWIGVSGWIEDSTLEGGILTTAGTTGLIGTFTNHGTFFVETSSRLEANGAVPAVLGGTGSIDLRGINASSVLRGPITNGLYHAITGTGRIEALSETNVNLGEIRADDTSGPLKVFGALRNAGLMRATGGAVLQLDGADVDNTKGVIRADAASNVSMIATSPLTVRGGRLTGPGTFTLGGLTLANGSDGSAMRSDASIGTTTSNTITMTGTRFQNDGTFTVGQSTSLSASGAEFAGTGEIVLGQSFSGIVHDFTQEAGHTIRGAGIMQGSGTAQNFGTITADSGVDALDVEIDILNLGTMSADGGTLEFTGADVDNTNGVIRAESGSTVVFAGGGGQVVSGGQLTGPGSFTIGSTTLSNGTDSSALRSDAALATTGQPTVTMTGTRFENEGTFTVGQSTALSASGAEFAGTGEIVLSQSFSAINHDFTQEAGHTIRGAGIFGGTGTVTNHGTITADSVVDPLDVSLDLVSDGLLRATGGGQLTITGSSLQNDGSLEVDAGSSVLLDSGLTLSGTGSVILNASDATVLDPGPAVANPDGHSFAGIGTIAPAFSNSGELSPGIAGAGTLSFSDSLTLNATSLLSIQLDSDGGSGVATDLIAATGATTLGGTLSVALLNGIESSISTLDLFTILSGSSLSGAFANVANGGSLAVPSIGMFTVNYGAGSAYASNEVVLSDFALIVPFSGSSVPEPRISLLMLGVLSSALALRHRSRGRRVTSQPNTRCPSSG